MIGVEPSALSAKHSAGTGRKAQTARVTLKLTTWSEPGVEELLWLTFPGAGTVLWRLYTSGSDLGLFGLWLPLHLAAQWTINSLRAPGRDLVVVSVSVKLASSRGHVRSMPGVSRGSGSAGALNRS